MNVSSANSAMLHRPDEGMLFDDQVTGEGSVKLVQS